MKKINFIFYIMMIVSLLVVSCDNTEISGTKPTSTTSSTTIPGAEKCENPVITGTDNFTSSTSVTISCSTEGAEIHYTTDGSPAGAGSPKYTGAFTITKTTTVSAVAIKSGYNNSDVVSKKFSMSNTPTTTVASSKCGVMIQAFNWESASRTTTSKQGKWYGYMKANADAIKDTFEYVWCPPPSMSASFGPEGYLPTQLNDLNSLYGTKAELTEVVNAIKPAKAIADVVINHRCGSANWGTFTNPSFGEDYYAICSDDEGFSDSGSDMYGSSKKGAADTGAKYSAARDLDHTNATVQSEIIKWMNEVLKPVGFVGWRYDYVKGYGPEYVGKYNKETSAAFSVGEYWPTDTYNASGWGSEIKTWIAGTASNGGQKSRAFDFALKGAMNTVFGYNGGSGNGKYEMLADNSNLMISQPADAVTFVDNHDTGSTQKDWYLSDNAIGQAYALILTHPGIPCVAWQHYFTDAQSGNYGDSQYIGGSTVPGAGKTYRQLIDELIDLRKEIGIEYDSERTTLSTTGCYAAEIEGTNGSIITVIGNTSYTPADSDYEEYLVGTGFKVFVNIGSSTPKCKAPVITLNGDKATITCSTDGATIKYGFSASSITNTYSSPVTLTDGQTIYAKATKSGLEDSKVVSATYTVITTVTLSCTSDAGWGNAIYFAGEFVESSNWTVAVKGTWTEGNVWVAEVTPPEGGTFEWKAIKANDVEDTLISKDSLTISAWSPDPNKVYPSTNSFTW